MHYLEDDLDLLDGVTEELKAQCFEMRELDSRVEKALSDVREESRVFFDVIKSLSEEERAFRYQKIKEEYRRIREMGEEKVAIAEFLELMLEKYQERIAKDLSEFKLELEADTPGITESIEKELCETIKNACNQKKLKSLVVSIPSSSAINNNDADNLGEAEDSGFEDVKPSTSGNYRVNGSRYGNQIEHYKASTEEKLSLPSPVRHQKRGSISSSGSNSRHSTLDRSSPSLDSPSFLPPPVKKKSNHSAVSVSGINYASNVNSNDAKADRKQSRLLTPKLAVSSSVLKTNNYRQNLNNNGPITHQEKASSQQVSRSSSKLKKMTGYTSNTQRWSPSSNYLYNNNNNNSNCILSGGGSSSASASTTPSPTLQNTGNVASSSNWFSSSSSQSFGYHYPSSTTVAPVNSSTIVSSASNVVGTSKLAMPSFAGGQESQYGRPVKLTSRVQQMLKDRQSHRLGRLPFSSANANYLTQSSGGVWYGNSASFSEDENRDTTGFRQRTLSNTQRRRRVIVEDDDLDNGDVSPSFNKELEEQDVEDEENFVDDEDLNGDEIDEENAEEDEDQDNNVWCVCRQKSEGDMVACDNKNCPYEWFHYECVGITAPPRGKWFCPVCTKNMRRSRSISMDSH